MLRELSRAEGAEPAAEREQRVTPLELFFDLVFVFAITQVSGFLYANPTTRGLVEAVALLMVLWFAWVGYAWLGNTAGRDDGPVRAVLLVAMGPLLVASLAVPRAFGRDALAFGLAYFFVRALHIVAYLVLAADDRAMRTLVWRLARTALPAAALLVLAGVVDEPWRAVCWALALAIDWVGLLFGGTDDWRVEPGHFAERHGLIVIIALGESIVAVGAGAAHLGLGAGVVTGVLLGIAIAATLWWAYFDVVATVAERKLREADQRRRARIARDSYTYLHFPMVAGIVVFAFGVKSALSHVGSSLDVIPAVALCGGVACYLVALSAFKRRNIGSFNYPRLVAAGVLLALVPVATTVHALPALALVAGVCCALIAYEVRRYAEARERIRHGSG